MMRATPLRQDMHAAAGLHASQVPLQNIALSQALHSHALLPQEYHVPEGQTAGEVGLMAAVAAAATERHVHGREASA